ncbi:ParA family protein [Salmonella enterica]
MFELKPDMVLDQDIHRGISILAKLRDSDLPFEIRSYDDKRSMLKALKEAKDAGKSVLVDCGGFDSDITRAVVAVADLIIVPAADTPTERIGLSLFDNTLEEVGRDLGIDVTAYLLVCKTHPNKKRFPKLDAVLSNTKHIRRLDSVLGHRPDHYESHEFGLGVTERISTRHTAAAKEIIALANEIRELTSFY